MKTYNAPIPSFAIYSVLSLIGLLMTVNTHAQILKISRTDLAKDSAGIFAGDLNLNFNINNRNATPEENLVYVGLEFNNNLTYLSSQHAYLLINKLNYFTITDGPIISTGYAHGRVNFKRRQTLSYELFTQIQYDDGRRMPLRYLFGGGVRIKILKGDKGDMYAGAGIMNEFEEWRPFEDDNVITKQIWKSTNYLSGTVKPSDNFTINIITYYQGGYDDESEIFRHRISGDISFDAKVTGKLMFTTNFMLLYESDPIISINPIVYSLTNGLKLNF